MDAPVVQTDGLTKYYGTQRGIEDVTFETARGEVFGFLGPNGAGKSTTIRTLLDLIRPTRGRARILGLDARGDSVRIRARTGYLPGDLSLYRDLTGAELLRHFAHLRGGVPWLQVMEVAEPLGAPLDRPVRTLSHGNRQKIGLIQAFMHRPELVVLDEPTSGLDPLMQQEFYRLVAAVRADGRTVFLSSHNLPEVERLCDRVAIIRDGRLVAIEDVAALKERAVRRLEIHFSGPVSVELFEALPEVRDATMRDGVLRCTLVGSVDAVIKAAARHTVVNVVSEEPSIEEAFLGYYGGSEGAS